MTEQLDWLKTSKVESDINVQGSKAWLDWRGRGLGSSDAAVLLGWSPWKTIEQLIAEKRGHWKQEFGDSQRRAMNRGKELEPVIRKWYEEKAGAAFPDAIATDPTHDYMRASFDGVNRTVIHLDLSVGRMIEIKAPNARDHEQAKAGLCPEKYVPQVQWLLMIGRLPWADYVSYGTDGTYAVVPMRADPVIQAELRTRAVAAWNLVQNPGLEIRGWIRWIYPSPVIGLSLSDVPFELPPGSIVHIPESPVIAEQETEAIVARALDAQKEVNAATARFEALKEILKGRLGDRPKLICGEAVMEWQERKGAVDYTRIPQLKDVDLEPFRKKPVKAFLFKRISEERS